MANIPQKYRKSPEFQASVDYVDLLTGLGYEIFYGGQCNNGSLIVSPEPFFSERIHYAVYSNNGVSTGSYTTLFDIDFDINFTLPRSIKGDIYVVVPCGYQDREGDNYIFKVDCRAYHYDGSTETQIGSTATSREFDGGTTTTGDIATAQTACLKITSSNVTTFKKDETLRFSIRYYIKSSGSDNRSVTGGIGTDPNGRNDVEYSSYSGGASGEWNQIIEDGKTTQLSFAVPFKIPI